MDVRAGRLVAVLLIRRRVGGRAVLRAARDGLRRRLLGGGHQPLHRLLLGDFPVEPTVDLLHRLFLGEVGGIALGHDADLCHDRRRLFEPTVGRFDAALLREGRRHGKSDGKNCQKHTNFLHD